LGHPSCRWLEPTTPLVDQPYVGHDTDREVTSYVLESQIGLSVAEKQVWNLRSTDPTTIDTIYIQSLVREHELAVTVGPLLPYRAKTSHLFGGMVLYVSRMYPTVRMPAIVLSAPTRVVGSAS